MQKHDESEGELTLLQLRGIVQREEIDKPVLAYKVTGGRIELFLLGGSVVAVEADGLLAGETAGEIGQAGGRLEEMSFDQLYEVAQRLEIRGRKRMNKGKLVEAIQRINN